MNIKQILTTILLICTCLLCTSCTLTASHSNKAIGLEMQERIEWCGMRHIDANKDDLPRVLLVGDSIVGAHADKVSELLKDNAYCSWLTTSRCLGDPVFEQELELMLSQYDYAVIYFNNGLHGAPFTIKQYDSALDRVFAQLVDTGAIIVWRTITPINPNIDDKVGRERIDQRNAIAAKLAVKYSIEIDDLGTFRTENYIDSVHFNTAAIETQAKHVMKTIQKNIENEK